MVKASTEFENYLQRYCTTFSFPETDPYLYESEAKLKELY